ncbi:MAG TPA: cation-transporting P-type ATPase, partial [Candidatus Eisenbacteria bacterium]|nr:cation-transporting P-type ATPase [Candidatus Eisenbacteria bacterium]
LFGFFQEYRAQKALEKLKEFATPITRVVRNGKVEEIPITDVVVGDIVILESGDRIPADGVVASSYHLEIDESILTGESLPVIKDVTHEVLRGTFVTKGKGHMKVSAIGAHTRFGQITQTLTTIQTTKTPLQRQIENLSKVLSVGAIILAFVLIPIGHFQGREFFPLILLSVSIAIAAIPESLPGVITIALAIGTNRLAKKHAIVRKMASVETLGATQIILTDKTGTLTQNNMTVKKYHLTNEKNLSHVLEACFRGNSAYLLEGKDKKIIGDKTDGALLVWAKGMDGKYEDVLAKATVIDEYAFDNATKTIATVIERDTKVYSYVRGAPEEILQRSTLSEKEKKETLERINSFAKEGLRVIGFGYKQHQQKKVTRTDAETHLEFLGILGLYDPPRATAKQAMIDAKILGLRIIMVTGDNELTALAIAKEVGLVAADETVVVGSALLGMSPSQLKETVKQVNIFARVSPEQKLLIATTLQQLGYVVGVTGDGVNDALALEKADVGIAMGEKGSDVAKESADIVLSDDDIFTLVRAIQEGRRIYDNMLKAITYLLAGNLSEIFFVVFAILFDGPLALLPTQILWLNLITDGLPALALASGSHDTGALYSKPRNPQASILSFKRTLSIFLVGITFAASYTILFSLLLHVVSETFARTITFNIMVISQIVLAFAINKSLRGKTLQITAVITVLAQIAISTIPFFQHIFHLGW